MNIKSIEEYLSSKNLKNKIAKDYFVNQDIVCEINDICNEFINNQYKFREELDFAIKVVKNKMKDGTKGKYIGTVCFWIFEIFRINNLYNISELFNINYLESAYQQQLKNTSITHSCLSKEERIERLHHFIDGYLAVRRTNMRDALQVIKDGFVTKNNK